MYKFLGKPKWLGFHLLCIALIVAMVNLAFWQLRRLDERRDLNQRVANNSAAAVVPLEEVSLADPDAVEYRRVVVTGTYVGPQFEVVNLSQNGTTGSDPVNMLQLSDGSLIVINRGFLPFDADLFPPAEGETDIVGRLRKSRSAGTDQTVDGDGTVLIRRINVSEIGEHFDAPILPMYVEMLESIPADSPDLLAVPLPEATEGPHLSYTIQWFIFSACAAAGWILAVRRQAKQQLVRQSSPS